MGNKVSARLKTRKGDLGKVVSVWKSRDELTNKEGGWRIAKLGQFNDKRLEKNYSIEEEGSTIKGRLGCHIAMYHSLGHEFRPDITKESIKWVNHVKFALQVFPTFLYPIYFLVLIHVLYIHSF